MKYYYNFKIDLGIMSIVMGSKVLYFLILNENILFYFKSLHILLFSMCVTIENRKFRRNLFEMIAFSNYVNVGSNSF